MVDSGISKSMYSKYRENILYMIDCGDNNKSIKDEILEQNN